MQETARNGGIVDGYAAHLDQVGIRVYALDRDSLVRDYAILVVKTVMQHDDVSRGGVVEGGLEALPVLHNVGGTINEGEPEGEGKKKG